MTNTIMESSTRTVAMPERAGLGQFAGPSVMYLLDGFPKLSETFVLNEILQLQKMGIRVYIFSLNRISEAKVHQKAAALIDTTIYLSDRQRDEKIVALVQLLLYCK